MLNISVSRFNFEFVCCSQISFASTSKPKTKGLHTSSFVRQIFLQNKTNFNWIFTFLYMLLAKNNCHSAILNVYRLFASLYGLNYIWTYCHQCITNSHIFPYKNYTQKGSYRSTLRSIRVQMMSLVLSRTVTKLYTSIKILLLLQMATIHYVRYV